jgi:hypothetical protein
MHKSNKIEVISTYTCFDHIIVLVSEICYVCFPSRSFYSVYQKAFCRSSFAVSVGFSCGRSLHQGLSL